MRLETKHVLKDFIWLSVTVVLLHFVPLFAYGLILIALNVMFNHKHPEYFLTLLFVMTALTVANGMVVPHGVHWFIATKVAMTLIAVGLFIQNAGSHWHKPAYMAVFGLLYFYLIYMAGASIQGWMPLISEMKILLFTILLLACTQSVTITENEHFDFGRIRSLVLCFAVFLILGSVAVIPFPSIGRSMMIEKAAMWGEDLDVTTLALGQGLFNGMTWHSQALGPLCALFNALLLSDVLLNRRGGAVYWALLLSIPFLILYSNSRTAFFTYLCSIIFTLFFMMLSKSVSSTRKSNALLVFLIGAVILSCGLLATPQGREHVESFMRKETGHSDVRRDTSISTALLQSRMGKVEQSLYYFKQSPLLGNGFQVSREMQGKEIKSMTDLLSAPVEKGVIWTMVLEEGGVVGALIFYVFVVCIFVFMIKSEHFCFLSCFLTMLVLNSGEAMFFSPSGGGGIAWLLCFAAMMFDIERLRLRRKVMMVAVAQARGLVRIV